MDMTTRRLVIAVVGMPGSGKSTFSSIARELGMHVVNLGDVVREELVKRGLEQNLENIMKMARQLREILGSNAVAKLATPRIRRALETHCIVVVDGVRSFDELEYLRKVIDVEIIVLAIHAPPKQRFKRLIDRGRPGDPRTWEEFRRRDLEELSWGLGNVIALADVVILNEGSYEEFIDGVRNTLSKVYQQWCT